MFDPNEINRLAHHYTWATETESDYNAIQQLLRDGGEPAERFALACQVELGLANRFAGVVPIRRRNWMRAAAAAVFGGALGVVGTRTIDAREVRHLQWQLDELTEFQQAVRKYRQAFRLAFDEADRPAPAAMVVARNVVAVEGMADPELIERVSLRVDDGSEQELVIHGRTDGFGRFAGSYAFPHVEHGRLFRVVVKAIPFASQRQTLADLGLDEEWLTREAVFVGTPFGLQAMSNKPVKVNLLPGATIDEDELPITGSASESGSCMIVFRSAANVYEIVAEPFDVVRGQALPDQSVDVGRFPNGDSVVGVCWLPQGSSWNSALSATEVGTRLSGWPADVPQTSRMECEIIPVQLALPNADYRAARWALRQGGIVGAHNGSDARVPSELTDPHLSLQRVEFKNAPLSTLRPLRYVRELQYLSVPNAMLDDSAFIGISTTHRGLIGLSVGGTRITDASVTNEFCRLSELQMLDLQKTDVTERSLAAIAGNLQRLTSLNLRETRITSILSLAPMSQLRELDLTGTSVAAAQFDDLQQAIPELKIMGLPR